MSDDTKVKVVGLTKKFGDLLVLNDISFNVKKGDFVCIVGPTGCGKTTFLNLLFDTLLIFIFYFYLLAWLFAA